MSGILYIVSTPIGNLDDITFRAIETLKSVDLILAEDTRHSKHLLDHYQITTPSESFHEHNETDKTQNIIQRLESGQNIALISDAGTPLISDPGFVLVREAKNSGLSVVPIPGASALISALSASGLASNHFKFLGFLPSKQSARQKIIKAHQHNQETLIFYESPKRILASVEDLLQILGANRLVCLAKEITKSFETIITDTLENLLTHLRADPAHQKGEFVILISAVDKKDDIDKIQQLDKIIPILLTEMSASKAAKLASKITGVDKKTCYQIAIES